MAADDRRPVVLVIRDGWGENPHPGHNEFNAVHLAAKPVDDRLRANWPWTLIRTSGEDVGLPTGTMGNSEVGHQNIGAGRIVDQEVMRITRSIRDGSFFDRPALAAVFEHARRTGGRVHLMGLVSDGQVHSDIEHLFALIDLAARRGFPGDRLLVHVITDGRDTPPRSAPGYVERLERHLVGAGAGRIATVVGRYYAMDRDHRWERVRAAYAALTGRATETPAPVFPTAVEAIEHAYAHPAEGLPGSDEFVRPSVIADGDGAPLPRITDGDAVVFFNFRGDRPREITRAFVLDEDAWAAVTGGGFDRGPRLQELYFCTMSGYEKGLPVSAVVIDKPPGMPDILGEVVARAGLTQFRCAETEKYAHVTFFFNDYRETPFPNEHRLLAPSPKDVDTYDRKPEMSAGAVCAGVLERLAADDVEHLIVVNFANPDMVGHTGVLDAVIKAVETTDACVGRLVEATLARGGAMIVTADHGNAEQMWDPAHDCPHTAHTTNDVPLHVVGAGFEGRTLRAGGRLADIAPTLLALMGLERPAAMSGSPLLQPEPAPR